VTREDGAQPARDGRADDGRLALDLGGRLALRPPEAARALGVSERTFRAWLPRIPHIREGNVVLVPVEPLREWLKRHARSGERRVDATVRSMLGGAS